MRSLPLPDRSDVLRARRPLPVLVALFALALGAGCAKKTTTTSRREGRVAVTVAVAEQRSMPFSISATGTVEATETAAVGSQVGGTIVRVAFREGDEVRRGQVLFVLDARAFRTALAKAQATLARDRAHAESARLEAERAKKLYEDKVLAEAEWDAKRTAAEAATADVRADEAAVQAARLDLEYASIRAPIGGRTGRLMVHQGDYVRSATTEPLVTINRTRPILVRFTVPAGEVPAVQRYRREGLRVIVHGTDADTSAIAGRLVFVDNAVDPASGTLMLKGEFPNADGRLVPGQFVNVELVLYVQQQATIVPAPAVTTGQKGTFVYVLNADSTVAQRPVSVSRTVDQVAVLTGGVEPGETVVTDGQFRLAPGSKVLVRTEGSRGGGAAGEGGRGGGEGGRGAGAAPAGATPATGRSGGGR